MRDVLGKPHLQRQWDILSNDKLDIPITVIGAGAIGSFTVLSLAKMGFEKITVYDNDDVSIENMSCQFFRHSDIGKPKAEALKSLVKDFTEIEITAHNKLYEGEELFSGIIITAVDSMQARETIYRKHKFVPAVKYIIDPRMSAETALLYTVNPCNLEETNGYAKALWSDEESVQERCTAKSTMYTVNLLSGMVAKTVKNIVMQDAHVKCLMWDIKSNDMTSFNADLNV